MTAEPLVDHRYTIIEIDRMRQATDTIMFPTVWLSSTLGYRPGTDGQIGEHEKKVEDRLRTYLLAGVRPEELEELAKATAQEAERNRISFEKTA